MQTFYGMSIPFYEFKGERNDLNGWAAEKGKENIEQYWKERKQTRDRERERERDESEHSEVFASILLLPYFGCQGPFVLSRGFLIQHLGCIPACLRPTPRVL